MSALTSLSYGGRSLAAQRGYQSHQGRYPHRMIDLYISFALRAEREGRHKDALMWLYKAIHEETRNK